MSRNSQVNKRTLAAASVTCHLTSHEAVNEHFRQFSERKINLTLFYMISIYSFCLPK